MAEIVDFNKVKQQKQDEQDFLAMEECDELTQEIADEMNEVLAAYGFEVRDEQFAENFFLVMESVRSLLYSENGIHHPFQTMIENMIDVAVNEETNTYHVYWKERPTDEGFIQGIVDIGEEFD